MRGKRERVWQTIVKEEFEIWQSTFSKTKYLRKIKEFISVYIYLREQRVTQTTRSCKEGQEPGEKGEAGTTLR